ncbi:MAG: ADP-glyceromanno-heptose 6-epimerase [Bacteroidales bacterium]|jgi:ADP-L-glycero-D-manno-heptose 6-epimerase|nr:ADP-glyceromanno-heptose 6-epimerase [Bacteroidales bacterium]MDD4213362.1 ADP-glyceromanno-heptose 6-epimerase [Bacteroidales bacterium]
MSKYLVVTGAAGFIGSCMVGKLNNKGIKDLIIVDDFNKGYKQKNIIDKVYAVHVQRDVFFEWFRENHEDVEFIFHLGARTDTTEFDVNIFNTLNLNYSKQMWQLCSEFGIPLVYASSAATYGLGELGYDDDESLIPQLKPLNPYGESKNEFDKWVIAQKVTPPFWAGLKFFNVYGPNEYHKGRMASVIFHAYNQINETGQMKLFRSHNPQYENGKQMRDFIYVKDVVNVCLFFYLSRKNPGIYNLGTGQARTFLDLVTNTYRAMHLDPKINFIDTPEDIRDKYQYFTEARMEKLRAAGYNIEFTSLEEGIEEYVQSYLMNTLYY